MVELSKYSAGSVSFPTSFHHSQIMALIFPPSSPLTYSVTKAASLLINRRTLATTGALSRSQPHVPELPEPREPRSVLMSPSTTERALWRPRDSSSKPRAVVLGVRLRRSLEFREAVAYGLRFAQPLYHLSTPVFHVFATSLSVYATTAALRASRAPRCPR